MKWIWKNGFNWKGVSVVIALVMMIITISGWWGRRFERAIGKEVEAAVYKDCVERNIKDIQEVRVEVSEMQEDRLMRWKENDEKLSEVNVKLARVITDLDWVKKGVYQLLNEK